MSFKFTEFLEVAHHLDRQGRSQNKLSFSKEAAVRCAVSRAYYAAFHHARDYVAFKSWYNPTRRGDDHDAVRKALRDHNKKNDAARLRRLRVWRNQSDYDLFIPSPDYKNMSYSGLQQASLLHKNLTYP